MEREQRLRQSLWKSSIRILEFSWKTVIYNLCKFIFYMAKALGTLCSCPQGAPSAKHAPIEANKSAL